MLDIYAHYIQNTAVLFAQKAPTLPAFQADLAARSRRYPVLVAEQDGTVVGYAYASPFHSGPAYDWSAETTIYLRPDCRGQGLGRALYERLEALLRQQNVLRLYACIVHTDTGDAYLTSASENFHRALGFVKNTHFAKCGCKFGKWYDVIWMEKVLGPQEGVAVPFLPFDARQK